MGNLQQHIDDCKERKNVLKKTLEELELKQAKLKFNQPISTTRCCWPQAIVLTRPPPLGGTCPNRHPDLHPTAAMHSFCPGRVSELPALLLAEHPNFHLWCQSSLSLCLAWKCCLQHGAGLQLGVGQSESFWSSFGVSLHPYAAL